MSGRYGQVEQVQALLGDEVGTLRRSAPYRVALCYPSPYRVGMSSLGFQTIYREVNRHPEACGERCFLPDEPDEYRRHRLSPFTFESLSPLSSCQMLAFSVSYELELTGLFTLLELSGIPVLREERTGRHPLIVAGGPLTFSNPDPLEPFIDVLVQGEAEDLIRPLLDAASTMPRASALALLATVPGFRVPGLSPESTRYQVAKASDVRLPAYSQIVTPHTELRSMFLIEPERGCSRGCHYCVMRRTTNGGMRTVPPERVLELIPAHARRVGLVGAAVTDHPRIVELLQTLVGAGKEVGVSSLRADRLTQPLVDALRAGAQPRARLCPEARRYDRIARRPGADCARHQIQTARSHATPSWRGSRRCLSNVGLCPAPGLPALVAPVPPNSWKSQRAYPVRLRRQSGSSSGCRD